jgi:hypothetical protein
LAGELVFIRCMGALNPKQEHIDEMIEDPTGVLTGLLQILSKFLFFGGYNQFGIKVRGCSEPDISFFLPWGRLKP